MTKYLYLSFILLSLNTHLFADTSNKWLDSKLNIKLNNFTVKSNRPVDRIFRELTLRIKENAPDGQGINYIFLISDDRLKNAPQKKFQDTKIVDIIRYICEHNKITFTKDNNNLLLHEGELDWSEFTVMIITIKSKI